MASLDERLLFTFLREAPRLPGADDLGVATAPVLPRPHQQRIVRRAVESFPQSFLFADEVGLGKTVEAALVLRQLVISSRVRRALLLVPKSVLRQWQEELWEKAALDVPRFDGGLLRDVRDREVDLDTRGADLWNTVGLVLVSSQLAKRRARREELLAADPWDLVLVDEAHHARRRNARTELYRSSYRPNRLLELLAGHGGRPGLRDRARAVYLLTATPMQVHPVEVWDLLRLLGVGGRWGAFEDDFVRYFAELRRHPTKRDWSFLLAMLADHLTGDGTLDPAFREAAAARLGEAGWRRIEDVIAGNEEGGASDENGNVDRLDDAERDVLGELLKRHTPLRHLSFRSTRGLLRDYHRRGLVAESVPERRPENVWIPMTGAERELYERIETYLVERYRRAEAQSRGLGFVMTVLRRRLTSSFAAIEKSLERRLERLRSGAAEDRTSDDENRTPVWTDEGTYLESFLDDLRALPGDSKVKRLLADLERLLAERDRVLVFTQYTDTLDALSDALRPVYGDGVAGYSGRGGEIAGEDGWIPVTKEEIKERFRTGEIRVLLCTEAASEGLNLQTCGVLINFDMPWNPMRVEQRIGRIDRIGQTHAEVWIKSYFYEETVEAEIYRRLADRIAWFEGVVGELQPILHRIGESTERLAMLPTRDRRRRLEEELLAIDRELEMRPSVDLGLDDAQELTSPVALRPAPVDLAELERSFVTSATFGERLRPDPELGGVYRLRHGGQSRRITFSPEVFDRHPSTVELLTYGTPLCEALLAEVEAPEVADEPAGLGLYRSENPVPLGLFVHPEGDRITVIDRLDDLRRAAAAPAGPWSGRAEAEAGARFSEARRRRMRGSERSAASRRRGAERALAEAARRILRRAAALLLVTARHPTLFDDRPTHGFGHEAVAALRDRGTPYAELYGLAAEDDPALAESLAVRPDDPFHRDLVGRSPEELERRSRGLAEAGREILARHRLHTDATGTTNDTTLGTTPGTAGPVIDRLWFPPEPVDDEAPAAERPFRAVPPSELRPWDNALPLFDDLADAADRLEEALDDGGLDLETLASSADAVWVASDGRTLPAPGLFLAPIPGEALSRRLPAGAWAIFRAAPRRVERGQIVLVRHPEIRDSDLGGDVTLRIYELAEESDDGFVRRRVLLKSASTDPSYPPIVLEDVEEGTFQVLARLIEVLV